MIWRAITPAKGLGAFRANESLFLDLAVFALPNQTSAECEQASVAVVVNQLDVDSLLLMAHD